MTERTVVTPLENVDCTEAEPFLRVLRGNPTPEEIAALVIVFLERVGEADVRPVRRDRSAWAHPSYVLRRHRNPGRGLSPVP